MKPLMSESKDNSSLQALGRASVQIVHDLKNQINGLKLYATFLRKRSERSERPADEIETINKLITGLDRIAVDLSMIVELGQPLELNKHAGVNLTNLLQKVAASVNDGPRVTGALQGPILIEADQQPLSGEFDAPKLEQALKAISASALKLLGSKTQDASLNVVLQYGTNGPKAEGIIDWKGFGSFEHDPFHAFSGSDGIRLSLAARIVEAHGGSAEKKDDALRVRLPITS